MNIELVRVVPWHRHMHSRKSYIAEARVQSQESPCEVYVRFMAGNGAPGQLFLQMHVFSFVSIISPVLPVYSSVLAIGSVLNTFTHTHTHAHTQSNLSVVFSMSGLFS